MAKAAELSLSKETIVGEDRETAFDLVGPCTMPIGSSTNRPGVVDNRTSQE